MKYYIMMLFLLTALLPLALYAQSRASVDMANDEGIVVGQAPIEAAEEIDVVAPAGFFTMTAGSFVTAGRVLVASNPSPEVVSILNRYQAEKSGIEEAPEGYLLQQNYPNPFNPATWISFSLPDQATVTLKVYNILGQEVATLLDKAQLDAGDQEIQFHAMRLASGVYFYRLDASSTADNSAVFTEVKKMVLLK